MNRSLLAAAFLALIPVSVAQAVDIVTYQDRPAKNAKAKLEGTIQEETAAGLKILTAKDRLVKQIAAMDVVEIEYEVPGDVSRIEFHKPFNLETNALKASKPEERQEKLVEAAQEYGKVASRIKDAKNVRRYLQFRAALALVLVAEEDRGALPEALAALSRFRADNDDSWEVLPCTQTLAHLFEVHGDLKDAEVAYRDLLRRGGDLPSETRRDVTLALVGLMVRGKQYKDAETKIEELRKGLPPDDPAGGRLQVELSICMVGTGRTAEAEKELQAALAGPADNATKARASNTLADLYLNAGKEEEAFWRYLWVDVLYNDDPTEHARALYHLSKLFIKVRHDPKKAEQCRKQLLGGSRFSGSEYQRLAAGEK